MDGDDDIRSEMRNMLDDAFYFWLTSGCTSWIATRITLLSSLLLLKRKLAPVHGGKVSVQINPIGVHPCFQHRSVGGLARGMTLQ